MLIPRFYDNLEKHLEPGRVLILYGPRRVGKTTILNQLLIKTSLPYRIDTGDDLRLQSTLGSLDFDKIADHIGDNKLIAIDEAQYVPSIGKVLKIIVDQHPSVAVVATGSSSFDLSSTIGEPLTGRKNTLNIYPLAQLELLSHYRSRAKLKDILGSLLIFGSYPEVVTAASRVKKTKKLEEIAHSYLFKDILAFERLKNPMFLLNLIKLIAFQVGSEVSLNELATQLNVHVATVGRYLDLLEKTFVLYKVSGFSRNLRSEVTNKHKYYFLDNGIRNAVIGQFNPLDSRDDVGKLWENFIFSERFKQRSYRNIFGTTYFWRTYNQQEIDFVEERDGKLYGWESKWSVKKPVKPPRDWQTNYPEAKFSVITPENYLNLIT